MLVYNQSYLSVEQKLGSKQANQRTGNPTTMEGRLEIGREYVGYPIRASFAPHSQK